jgi:hypothetical protein
MLSLLSKVTTTLVLGLVVGVPIWTAVKVCVPPPSAVAVTPAGHEIVGGVASTTVIVKLQLPPPVSELTLTTVVPTGKKDPLGGLAKIAPQVPKGLPAAKLTIAPGLPPWVVLATTEKFS